MIVAPLILALTFQGTQQPQRPYKPEGEELAPIVYDIADVGDVLNVRMKVNGVEGVFTFDTGSFNVLVTPEFADKANLETTEVEGRKIAQIGFDYGRIRINADAEVRPIGVKDDGTPGRWKLAGIIGLSVFRNRCLGIDTINRKVVLWPNSTLSQEQRTRFFEDVPYMVPGQGLMWAKPGSNFTYRRIRFVNSSGKLNPAKARLESEDSIDNDDHYRIACAVNGKPVSLALDTGSGGCMVRKSLANWGRVIPLGDAIATGIDSNWKGTVAIADSIAFAEQRAFSPRVLLLGDDFPLDGLVGFDLFEGTRTLIEFSSRRLSIAKDPTVTTGATALMPFGLRLIGNGAKIYLGVVPGSSAEAAGFRSGDEIAAIGNTTPTRSEVDESQKHTGIYVKFSGVYPLTLDVTARRGRETIKRTLSRQPGDLHQQEQPHW
jgi:predicted aspartyl protease